jgi:hypothetical protein
MLRYSIRGDPRVDRIRTVGWDTYGEGRGRLLGCTKGFEEIRGAEVLGVVG